MIGQSILVSFLGIVLFVCVFGSNFIYLYDRGKFEYCDLLDLFFFYILLMFFILMKVFGFCVFDKFFVYNMY